MDERVSKYFQDELSPKERVELLQDAFRNEDLKKKFIKYQNIHTLSGLAPQGANQNIGRLNLDLFLKEQQRNNRKKFLIRGLGYASVVAILIVVVWISAIGYSSQINVDDSFIAEQQEFFVPAGQRARIKLPDGTYVWLNAGSVLTYPSVFGKERRVTLQGEGFFDVAKNPDSPFIVSAGSLDIKALGTQFNVFCYPDAGAISTSLLEGTVRIYHPEDEKNGVILKPNQQLLYEQNTFRTVTMQNNDDLLWKEGIYYFKSEMLDAIIKKLELYYDVKIVVKDPEILTYRYTGKFRQRDGVVEILRIIQKIHHFKMDKDDEQNMVTLYK